MIRNLKVLMLAAMVVAAFGAFSASGAQAAEFHCSVAPCTYTAEPDETAGTKTAHHVFVITGSTSGESVSITCNQLSGEGTSSAKTASSLTLKNVKYTTCTFLGSATTVNMNGCEYVFTASGSVSVTCPAGKAIEFGTAAACLVKVGAQGPLTEVKYHNIGTSGTTSTKVTVETAVKKIASSGEGPSCPKGTLTGEYTTGNTIVKAETDASPAVAAEGWWV